MNSRINTIIIVILLSAIMLMLFISVGMLNKIQVASSTNNEIVLKAGEEKSILIPRKEKDGAIPSLH